MPRQVFLIKFLVFLLFLLLQLRPFSRPRGGLVPGLELPFLERLLALEISLVLVKLYLFLQNFLRELCFCSTFGSPLSSFLELALFQASAPGGMPAFWHGLQDLNFSDLSWPTCWLDLGFPASQVSNQRSSPPGSWHDEPVFVDPCPGFVSSHSCHGLFPGHLCHGLVPCSYWSPQTCFCGPFLFTCTQVF